MSGLQTRDSFTFVVDTDKYSGNFCREMCAYMTGRIGDCGTGAEEQRMFMADFDMDDEDLGPFKEQMEVPGKLPDNSDCTVWYDDLIGMTHDSFGVNRPCKEMSNPAWSSNKDGDFCKNSERGKASGFIMVACMSVGIVLTDDPDDKSVEILKERALKYGAMNGIQIEGFRLVVEHTVEFSRKI